MPTWAGALLVYVGGAVAGHADAIPGIQWDAVVLAVTLVGLGVYMLERSR